MTLDGKRWVDLQAEARGGLTVKHAQSRQPWTIPYSAGVERASRDSVPHIMGSHCALHAAKTAGKLAAVFEALDHRASPITDEELATVRDMSADLMTAALRFANLYRFDLETALRRRVFEKNGVQL